MKLKQEQIRNVQRSKLQLENDNYEGHFWSPKRPTPEAEKSWKSEIDMLLMNRVRR